jgi:hypothetical protein
MTADVFKYVYQDMELRIIRIDWNTQASKFACEIRGEQRSIDEALSAWTRDLFHGRLCLRMGAVRRRRERIRPRYLCTVPHF